MSNELKIKNGLIISGSASTLLDVRGSLGSVFKIDSDALGSWANLYNTTESLSDVKVLLLDSSNKIVYRNLGSGAFTTAANFVTTSTTITINGTTFNLSANRTWNVGTVTGVNSGNGLNFTNFSTSGTITLGTPSDITLSSSSSVSTNSHSHKFTPGGTTAQYISGAGTLVTFPSLIHTHTTADITLLTGYVLGTNVTITTSDSLNTALGKIQAQINSRTFSVGTLIELNAGTDVTGKLQSAKLLNDWINAKGYITSYVNTTYSAGLGLTLTNTVFSLPVTQAGSGDYISSVAQNANGITVTKSTFPITALVTSTTASGVINETTSNLNTFLNVTLGGASPGSSTQVTGSGGTSVSSDVNGKLTISSTNTTYLTGTLAELNTGTLTTGKLQTAKILNDWIDAKGYITSFTDTTYLTGTLVELNAGTDTTGKLQTAKILNDWIDAKSFALSSHNHVISDLTGTLANSQLTGSYSGLTNLTGSGTVDFRRFLGNTTDTAALPSFSFTADPNTGMWSVGADQLGFTTGGTNRLTISTTALTSTLIIYAPGGNSTEWNTAVGWGNHATAGYITSAPTYILTTLPILIAGTETTAKLISAKLLSDWIDAKSFALSTHNHIISDLTGTLANSQLTGSYSGLTNLTGSGTVDFGRFLGNTTDTAALPSFSFTADPNTGMWSVGGDQLGFSTGGVNRLTISTSAFTSTLNFGTPAGTALLPSHTFSADTNTGMWNSAADTISFTTGGVTRLTLTGTTLTGTGIADFAKFLGNTADTAALPSFSFTADPNTGMWSVGADQLGFTTGGTNRLTISTTALTSTLIIYAPGGNSTEWNTAVGWGNHATAGYITSSATYTAGTNINITGSVISGAYNVFSTGNAGLVPARVGALATKYLREDGTWVTPTNTTYSSGTKALLDTGTSGTVYVYSPLVLNQWLNGKNFVDIENVSNFNTPNGFKILYGSASSASNTPLGNWTNGIQFQAASNTNYFNQLVFDINGRLFTRTKTAGVISDYREVSTTKTIYVTTSITIIDSMNGSTFVFLSNSTVTLSNGLASDFVMDFWVIPGRVVSFSLQSPLQWLTGMPTPATIYNSSDVTTGALQRLNGAGNFIIYKAG